MDFAKVSVEVRIPGGKGAARKVRAAGKVPAVLYGHKQAPVSVSLDPNALVKSLDKERKRNTVFSLALADGGKTETVTAMIRDAAIDPMTRRIVHIDFLRVSLDEEVRVSVPLILKGSPIGVVNGGNLHQSMHELPIAAKPDAIPARIEVDVTALDIGMALHVSDLQLPAGVRPTIEGKDALASVVAPRAEKLETAAPEAAAAEGAAAAPAAADAKEGGKKEGPAAKEGGDKEKKGK